MKEYQYSIHNHDIEDLITIRSKLSVCDAEFIAEEAAHDHWENNDGWEASWPINFFIFKDMALIGSYKIDMDFEPKFGITEHLGG
jgi:hypothetical protein